MSPGDHDKPDPRLAAIWDESRRAVDGQAGVLSDIRARATAVLGAASIAGAFLVQESTDSWTTVYSTIGTVAFAVVGFLTAALLRSTDGWRFHRNPADLLTRYVEGPTERSIDSYHRNEALHMRKDFKTNSVKLLEMHKLLSLSVAALVFEIAAFFLATVYR